MIRSRRPWLALLALAISAAVLSACTAPPTPLETALACLQDKGVDADIQDGALVVTRRAGDSAEVDVDAAVEECVPEELRGA